MSVSALRPRSSTELIDASFQLVRLHYVKLITIAGAALLPAVFLRVVLPTWLAGIAPLFDLLFDSVAYAAITIAVSDLYLGNELDPGSALKRALARPGSLALAAFGQGLLIVIGLLLLIVPGVILFRQTFAMLTVVALEKVRGRDSYERSRELSRGESKKIFATYGLTFLIYQAVLYALVFGVMAFIESERSAELTSELLKIFVYPLVVVVSTLLYYDIRIRKEGFDIEMLAAGLDAPDAPHAATPMR